MKMSCHLAFLSADDTFFQLQKDFVKAPINPKNHTRGGAGGAGEAAAAGVQGEG